MELFVRSLHQQNWNIPDCGVRPLKLVILSRRAEPPSLILASRRSRRRREARWAGDSSGVDIWKVFKREAEVRWPDSNVRYEHNQIARYDVARPGVMKQG
jgi:hypothetical protein